MTQLMRLIYNVVVKICTDALSQFSGSKFVPPLLSLFPSLSVFIPQQVLFFLKLKHGDCEFIFLHLLSESQRNKRKI